MLLIDVLLTVHLYLDPEHTHGLPSSYKHHKQYSTQYNIWLELHRVGSYILYQMHGEEEFYKIENENWILSGYLLLTDYSFKIFMPL